MDHPFRRRSDYTWYKWLTQHAPKHIKVGVFIAALVWGWIGFKKIEPKIMPVVKDFSIDEVVTEGNTQRISGLMNKVRNCDFVELVAYSGNHLIGIGFTETPAPVSRVEGKQEWGWWVITPPVKQLTLYVNHACATGKVTTKLWEGEL